MKKFVFALAIAAGTLFAAGCDKAASSASKDVKDAAKDMKEAGKDMKDAAKDLKDKAADSLEKMQKEVTDKFDLKGIETAIGKLPADKMAAAKTAWDNFNKQLADFKAAPMDKMAGLKDALIKAYDDLKKLAGL